MKAKDLTGQKFGRWTAVERLPHYKNKHTYYKCICECGNVGYVYEYQLTLERSRSCGCLRSDLIKERCFKNLVGQRFGKLLVVGNDENKHGKYNHSICKCDCGNIISVRNSALTTGNSVSCGCTKPQIARDNGYARRTKSEIIVDGDIAKIKLTNCNEYAIIDTQNIDKINVCSWSKTKQGYVVANIKTEGKLMLIHRIITGNDSQMPTDHINRNKLDNRECNLRITTNAINSHNKGISKNNTTGHKNIVRRKNRYEVAFVYCKKTYWVGTFGNIEEAIVARNKKYNELEIEIED